MTPIALIYNTGLLHQNGNNPNIWICRNKVMSVRALGYLQKKKQHEDDVPKHENVTFVSDNRAAGECAVCMYFVFENVTGAPSGTRHDNVDYEPS